MAVFGTPSYPFSGSLFGVWHGLGSRNDEAAQCSGDDWCERHLGWHPDHEEGEEAKGDGMRRPRGGRDAHLQADEKLLRSDPDYQKLPPRDLELLWPQRLAAVAQQMAYDPLREEESPGLTSHYRFRLLPAVTAEQFNQGDGPLLFYHCFQDLLLRVKELKQWQTEGKSKLQTPRWIQCRGWVTVVFWFVGAAAVCMVDAQGMNWNARLPDGGFYAVSLVFNAIFYCAMCLSAAFWQQRMFRQGSSSPHQGRPVGVMTSSFGTEILMRRLQLRSETRGLRGRSNNGECKVPRASWKNIE